MADDRSLFERDYAFVRGLAKATTLAVLLPKGFITRLFEAGLILFVLVLVWGVFTGPRTPPPLSIVKVDGPVEGLTYRVSAPSGDGAHAVEFRNDLDVRVGEVRFHCLSPTSGRFELLLSQSFEPRTSGAETVYGQSADARTACKLKSYETYPH
ncbi:hypothetical protein [Phenylobacterium sp. SCN 70-31]|uniref:hypothetical protein n=1 Tax=Phenylobacterium sp. SCN 70-31 TaxID=1660129 RepID=UPI0025EE1EC4|nr:hypothetical protein [Phenylobacterium sp. SCN 70-31]